MNYHDKKFRPVSNSENGESGEQTIFHYKQSGNIVMCEYNGGRIISGHLIGLVDNEGIINMSYHHINDMGQIMTGICISKPEVLQNGKLRLYEDWQWTSGDNSRGQSILEEI